MASSVPLCHSTTLFDPFNFNLNPIASFQYSDSRNSTGPAKAYATHHDPVFYNNFEVISKGIHVELSDNTKNGKLSDNALASRCQVFKSMFKTEVQGPTGSSNKMSTSRQRDGDDDDELIDNGSDEEDQPRNLAPHTFMASNDAPTAVRRPSAAKVNDTKMAGASSPKVSLSSISSFNGHNLDASKREAPVRKPRRTTCRGKQENVPKRVYRWQDPQNKNKKRLYAERALATANSSIVYIGAKNFRTGATISRIFDRDNVLDEFDELYGESFEFSKKKNNCGSLMSNEKNKDNIIEDDDQEQLFIQQKHPNAKIAAPVMTARRIAMIASQYMDELYGAIATEPMDGVKLVVKSALDKVKAGTSSQLSNSEQIELRLAVERYEAAVGSY